MNLVRLEARVTRADGWTFDHDSARQTLLEQLQATSLAGFGLDEHPAAVRAAGALVQYLRDTQKADLAHVREIAFRAGADCLLIDATTLRNLEVLEATGGGRTGSLLHEVDRTMTSMGGRLLRAWLLRPLLALERIQDRLDAVEEFAFRSTERAKLRDTLKIIHDIERLVARASLGIAGPRDLVALRQSLAAVPRVRLLLSDLQAPLVRSLIAELDDLADLRSRARSHARRRAARRRPGRRHDPRRRRRGARLAQDDQPLRETERSRRWKKRSVREPESARSRFGTTACSGTTSRCRSRTSPTFRRDYHRKQTIAGGERFITPELKDFEEKVLGADERILEHEVAIFERLRARVGSEAPRIQDTARGLAALDVLSAFAETAAAQNYTKPMMHAGDELQAVDVRHPVVERHVADAFVPNDVTLDAAARQLIVLTGPNMGGKSTYLRQTALLCLMAQAGSFVAARSAKLPIVDRVFARVGASDNIARGQSTFMVEMQETANILHSATSRSLLILDEIGRGTSTFDGLSLAWAVAEHLASGSRARPKTIFATHYHELTDLADALSNVANFHVVVREWQDDIVFLRKVVPGRSDRSYGIQVARLAGLPPSVVARAREILNGLERDELSRGGRPSLSTGGGAQASDASRQLGLFQARPAADDPVLVRLKAADVDNLTPLQALALLADLKREAGG